MLFHVVDNGFRRISNLASHAALGILTFASMYKEKVLLIIREFDQDSPNSRSLVWSSVQGNWARPWFTDLAQEPDCIGIT